MLHIHLPACIQYTVTYSGQYIYPDSHTNTRIIYIHNIHIIYSHNNVHNILISIYNSKN